MLRRTIVLLVFLWVSWPAAAAAGKGGTYQFLSPVPDSKLVRPENNVILREGSVLDPTSVDDQALEVTGDVSGVHAGRLVLADDAKTLVFLPDQPFAIGERVKVHLKPGVRTLEGRPLPPLRFEFEVMSDLPIPLPRRATEDAEAPDGIPAATPAAAGELAPAGTADQASCPLLEVGFPYATTVSAGDPEPGSLFLAPFNGFDPDGRLLIHDEHGLPVFYRRVPGSGFILDFKRQPDGRLTAFLSRRGHFVVLDSSYVVVDSIAAGNGYPTDGHELLLLPNGHAALMSYDTQRIAMDQVVPGGNPAAAVIGLVIQELDADRRVIFQWRSWDHFALEDAAIPGVSLTDSVIDYVHGNSIEADGDESFVISSRSLNEITKIGRTTGEVVWRFAPNGKHNDFTMLNDPRGFTHQHDARRLPDGRISLFDNGNTHVPRYSQALEYELDEVGRTATLAWSYKHPTEIYGPFMGSCQRLPGGGSLVCWGGTASAVKVTEVGAGGGIERDIGPLVASWSYRAFLFPWHSNRIHVAPDALDFGQVTSGSSAEQEFVIRNGCASEISIDCFHSTNAAFALADPLPVTIPAGGQATVHAVFAPEGPGVYEGRLYVQEFRENELVAEVIAVRGTTDSPVAVDGGPTLRLRLHPPMPSPFQGTVRIRFDLPRAGEVRVEILDVRGRRLQVLARGFQPAGTGEVHWEPKGLASGVYVCRLTAGGEVVSQRIVHLE